MSDYPPRVGKSERIYQLWESGEGDMGELAIGLYDLTAHYKALWDDYTQLEAENERLNQLIETVASDDQLSFTTERLNTGYSNIGSYPDDK